MYYLCDNCGDIIGWDKKTGKPGFYRHNAICACFETTQDALDFIIMLNNLYDHIPDLDIVRI